MALKKRQSQTSRSAMLRATRLSLAGEHLLELSRKPGEDTLVVSDQTGSICVTVVIAAGAVTVAATGAKLTFQTNAALELRAEHLTLSGRTGIALETEGPLVSQARSQRVTATLGSVVIDANDDVKLDGERILLNS